MFLWGDQSVLRVEPEPIYLGPFTPQQQRAWTGGHVSQGGPSHPLESTWHFTYLSMS